VCRYVVKLPDTFDFQGQVFMILNFLCLRFREVMGEENCYINHKCCFILSIYNHYRIYVEFYRPSFNIILDYLFVVAIIIVILT